jgi:hypothetical protein
MRTAKIALTIICAPLLLISVYYGFKLVNGLNQGYQWSDMDWDSNGSTSIFDLLLAGDIGSRELNIDGKSCREYFFYKDARPIKTVCH